MADIVSEASGVPTSGTLCGHSVLVFLEGFSGSALDGLRRRRCFGCEVEALGAILFSLEEALFLQSELKLLCVLEGSEALTNDRFFQKCCNLVCAFPRRFAAYRHYRLAGWVVRPDALKFGADLLLYHGRPDEVHAQYAVVLADESFQWKDAVMASRLAQLVAKELILAACEPMPTPSELPSEASLADLGSGSVLELVVRPWRQHLE
ncbi:unnamed protein product [Effrenium voratum]|nr:unnamed protein product [Effrenium voratum]